MKQSKKTTEQLRQKRPGLLVKWLCLLVLVMVIAPGVVLGSENPGTAGLLDQNVSAVADAVYEPELGAEAARGTVSGSVYADPDFESVYESVYGSVYGDDTLGVVLHHGPLLLGKNAMSAAVSAVEGALKAESPVLQQIKLDQASTVIPGGRGFMLPQRVSVRDLAGNPLSGIPVTFQVTEDSTVTAVMRGLNSSGITVLTDANGYASAANTYATYAGEGFQLYSRTTGVIRTLDVTASVTGLPPVTFKVEVGTVGSNLLDTTPPTISASAVTDNNEPYIAGTWTNRTVKVHYTAADTLSAIRSLTSDQTFTAEGAGQTATGKAVDSAAASDNDPKHVSTIMFGPIHIDKSAPVTAASLSNGQTEGWNREKVTLHFLSEDHLSGVDSIYYKLGDQEAVKVAGNTAETQLDTEGKITVSYWAVDKTGNAEAARTLTVQIDKTGPVMSGLLSPEPNAAGWNSGNVTVLLRATDGSSGVKELHYILGSSAEKVIQGAETSFEVTAEGIIPLTYWAVDAAGNETPAKRTEIKIDKTIPVLTVPQDITVEATAVRTPVAAGQATVQDVSVPDVVITNDAPADYPIGVTTVKWTAVDPVGLKSSQVQKITVKDTTKPVLTVQGDVVVEAAAELTPVVLSGASATDIFPVIVQNNAPKTFPVGTTEVIWTATDANGNEITAKQNVIIADRTKPQLNAPADITTEATARRTAVDIGKAAASDIFKVTVTNNAPADYPVGTTKVVWRAEDANGNVTLAEQIVTITDTTKPELTIPQDITMEATAKRMQLDIGKGSAKDIFEVLLSNNALADYPVGTTEVVWTAKDENGNVTQKVQKITVTDKTAPVLAVPDNKTVEATGIETPVDLGAAQATDIFKVTVTHNAPKAFGVGNTTVTWTATDEHGNTSTGKQEIRVVDTTAPLVTLPGDKTVEATGVRTPVELGKPVISEIFPVTVENDAPADYPLGETVVHWTITDANGNTTKGMQKVLVVDTTSPLLEAPGDVTVEATAVRSIVALGQAQASDLFEVKITNDAPQDFPVGLTEVKWMAKDASGNVAIDLQKVTVTDTTDPKLEVPAAAQAEATGDRTRVEIGQATATDIFPVKVTSDAPADYPVGITMVTWTATDANGRMATGKQEVKVIDSTAPVLQVPGDIRKEATAVNTPIDIGKATATDLFPVTITSNAPAAYTLGNTFVTWKAVDKHGNITTGTQTITVVDTTGPVIAPPAELKLEASAKETPVDLQAPAVTDIFRIAEISSNAPAAYPLGTTPVTWKVKDENGNLSSVVQKVTIMDTTRPELKVPGDISVEATAVRTPVAIGQAEGTDIFAVTVTSDAPADYPLGTTEVTWTAKDSSGNATTAVQKITVLDTTLPELEVPADLAVEATAVRTPVDIGKAKGSDIFPVTLTSNAPADYPLGTTEVLWTIKDTSGNTKTAVQKIKVTDTTKPVLAPPADLTVEAAAIKTPVKLKVPVPQDIFPVVIGTDAPEYIDIEPLFGGEEVTALFPVGKTLVHWTATDSSGNQVMVVQYITVVDTVKPELKAPGDITVEASAVRTVVNIGQAEAADIFPVTVTTDAPADYPLGTTEVTWTATDANGNEKTAKQRVTVVDTTKPGIQIPEDIHAEASAVRTPVETGVAKGTDIFPVTVTSNAPADYPLGTTEVLWTIKDTSGNETTAVQKVTVEDSTKPAMSFKGSLAVELEATGLETPVDLEVPVVADIFPVILTANAPGFDPQSPITAEGHITARFALGTTKVIWTAVDTSGNEITGIVTVNIKDTTKPVLKVPADILLEATALKTPVDIGTATATDIYPVTVSSDSPEAYELGTTTVLWTAKDANGNTITGEQKITVVDTTKPVMKLPEDKTVEATALKTPVAIGTATATDIYPVTVSSNAPEAYELGTTTVLWTAKDANGNLITGEQKITVVDTTKPKLTLPEDKTVEATALKTPVEIGSATATDIYPVTVSSNAPEAYELGTTTVLWTATDANGNLITGEQKITVVDTTKPKLTLPEDKTVEATALKTPVEIGSATSTDIYPVMVSSNAPEAYELGTTTVLWTATDANGNTITGEQKITVVDTTKPVLKLPEDKTVEATALKTPVAIGTATATDIYPVTVSSNAPEAYELGTTTVLWTAKDANGNIITGEQKITVTDKTKPVLKLPEDKTVEATALKTPVVIGTATATDIYPVTVTSNAPAVYELGTTTVLWTATDANGNMITGEQKITVVDKTKPVLKIPADISVIATGVKTPVNIGQASATDIFGFKITNNAPADGFPVGKTPVIWTVTDVNGNTATAVQYVTVTQMIKVQSYNSTRSATSNVIGPRISIENSGSSDIQLSNVKIRYYYTIDGERSQGYLFDYARVSGSSSSRSVLSHVSGSFQKTAGKTGSDYYLEISFGSGAGTLKAGEKLQIQSTFWKTGLSSYTQTNDYSFNATATDYTDTNKITIYASGNLVAGIEP
ncbi:HYR domain-containing protein [Paenibacillus tengchongensis]|uniref:HYR domain-containing protein n=1 Tax=Paenibacillus tengchongensis TaxID=2608684 RepID=UPI00124C82BB|nr:HYR domain-containing protein [Paenibacillus tengchongensis]